MRESPKPCFYAAVLVFETSSDAPGYKPLYSEEIMLIEATSEEQASASAKACAKGQETSYQNEYCETIQVRFKSLVDVQLMQFEPSHGATVYCRHFHSYPAYEAFELLASQ
ncbi:hypothetical protein S7335_1243 [Synechococcus sp. PCC 7335]|uniref:DUF4288 domain-containing protein n=1 Tax=Synechococcus sp. (strain ATCC 29403 / PCC 7335) TaxID=91464 RepID=UPI00017EB1CF|nr:DUF4288 domain-containing protein [Synechococcus sp. PCC 7335]EDX82539.1 hypothetical protein S7335_1243 [Synechococcus sp. PCC 7335]